jgi:class 3 adenylate cyclase
MRHDPSVVSAVLGLLQNHDWDASAREIQDEIANARNGEQREAQRFFLAWMAAERGMHEQADKWFKELQKQATGAAWAIAGRSFVAYRSRRPNAARLLAKAADHPSCDDDLELQGVIAQLRGMLAHQDGKAETALRELDRAWECVGPDHFGAGRILDGFATVYRDMDNYYGAELLYRAAQAAKEKHNDLLGLAVTQGNLGRLHLSWEDLDRAEECFLADLRICERTRDDRGKAQMYNHLGQVELARAEECGCREPQAAHRHAINARAWLGESIASADAGTWHTLAGYARKDRALAHLALGDLPATEKDLRNANDLFHQGDKPFAEGLAHVHRAQAIRRRRQGAALNDVLRLLRLAREHFERTDEKTERAITLLEVARTLRDGGSPTPRVALAYVEALEMAEASRRTRLIERVERELGDVDPQALAANRYRRVRGRSVTEETTSLLHGRRERVTVLYFDLERSTAFARHHDAAEVMLTINQLMAELVAVVGRHEGQVSGFRGDGFLVLFRDRYHARRAVRAGLDLFTALRHFNHPHRILKMQELVGRVGIATGEVVVGNVGTYDKMDWTCVGNAANLGARLEGASDGGMPCVDRETYADVYEDFRCTPRKATLKGWGDQDVWDVEG